MKGIVKAIAPGLGVLVLGILAVMAQSGPAYAVPYLNTSLTNWNVDDIQLTGDYVQVTAENTGVNTTLTFEFFYGTQPPTIQLSPSPTKGLHELGWNSAATIVTLPTGWSPNPSRLLKKSYE